MNGKNAAAIERGRISSTWRRFYEYPNGFSLGEATQKTSEGAGDEVRELNDCKGQYFGRTRR